MNQSLTTKIFKYGLPAISGVISLFIIFFNQFYNTNIPENEIELNDTNSTIALYTPSKEATTTIQQIAQYFYLAQSILIFVYAKFNDFDFKKVKDKIVTLEVSNVELSERISQYTRSNSSNNDQSLNSSNNSRNSVEIENYNLPYN